MQNSDFDQNDLSAQIDASLTSETASDIQTALKSHRFLMSEPWIRCNQCCYWIEQNFLQVAVLLSLAWLCTELCVYFGALVFIGELVWVYTKSNENPSNS
jgi:hypothetical protein